MNDERYVGHGEAVEATGWGAARLLRLALLGEIKTEIKPGRAIQYNLGDIERIMASTKSRRKEAVAG
jgi:hypothetical protein